MIQKLNFEFILWRTAELVEGARWFESHTLSAIYSNTKGYGQRAVILFYIAKLKNTVMATYEITSYKLCCDSRAILNFLEISILLVLNAWYFRPIFCKHSHLDNNQSVDVETFNIFFGLSKVV